MIKPPPRRLELCAAGAVCAPNSPIRIEFALTQCEIQEKNLVIYRANTDETIVLVVKHDRKQPSYGGNRSLPSNWQRTGTHKLILDSVK